jgi:hypothetical protein
MNEVAKLQTPTNYELEQNYKEGVKNHCFPKFVFQCWRRPWFKEKMTTPYACYK